MHINLGWNTAAPLRLSMILLMKFSILHLFQNIFRKEILWHSWFINKRAYKPHYPSKILPELMVLSIKTLTQGLSQCKFHLVVSHGTDILTVKLWWNGKMNVKCWGNVRLHSSRYTCILEILIFSLPYTTCLKLNKP